MKLIKLWEICPRNDDKKKVKKNQLAMKNVFILMILLKKGEKKRFESYTLKPINKKGI